MPVIVSRRSTVTASDRVEVGAQVERDSEWCDTLEQYISVSDKQRLRVQQQASINDRSANQRHKVNYDRRNFTARVRPYCVIT